MKKWAVTQNGENNCRGTEQGKKNEKKWGQSRDIWDSIKCNNMQIIGVPEDEKEQKVSQKIFKEIIVENFPNMGKEIVTQAQEAERIWHRINLKRNIPRHILFTLRKIKFKEKVLKAAMEKQYIICKGIPIRLSAELCVCVCVC